VVFLDPKTNAPLLPTLHVAQHVSHATLQNYLRNFRPNAALPTLSEFSHDSVLEPENSGRKLNFFPLLTNP
jgi:hypothetical protein